MPHMPAGFKRAVVRDMVALIMAGSLAIAQELGDPRSDPATVMV